MKISLAKQCKRISFCLLPTDSVFHNLVRVTGPFGSLCRVFNLGVDNIVAKSAVGGLKTSLQLLAREYVGLLKLFRQRFTLHGVGYKSYAPKSLSRSSFIFRVGFGAAEMRYNFSSLLKGRARKQKLMLLTSSYEMLKKVSAEIVQLKRADPYKGKGIRLLGQGYRQKQGKVRAR